MAEPDEGPSAMETTHRTACPLDCPDACTLDVRRGVASLPKGLWMKSTENGATANALCPDTLADVGRGACFTDARVEVEKVATA